VPVSFQNTSKPGAGGGKVHTLAGRGRKACYKQTEIFVCSKHSVLQEINPVASQNRKELS